MLHLLSPRRRRSRGREEHLEPVCAPWSRPLHGRCQRFEAIAINESVARNPSLRKELFNNAILGFALTEALGLFALMMALMFLYAF